MAELLTVKYDDHGKIFCPLKNAYHVATPEEKVRQNFICKLVNEYGYSLEQMKQEEKLTDTSERGTGKARADIIIWKSKEDIEQNNHAFIVVELKAENVKVRKEDYYQGSNYASWARAQFFVTSNEKETKFFKVNDEKLPTFLEEIIAIPTAKEVNDEKRIEQLKNQTKTFTREEFTKTLKSCHDIIRNNDKLSPEGAFDEISKLLFMKIRYERQGDGTKVFTRKQFEEEQDNYEKNLRPGLKRKGIDQSYMQNLFDTTKDEFRDDKLFKDEDTINIRENSFVQILEKLENYNLSDTQDDVKGIAFEQFLGTTFRGELGQFFTPRTIVDFMTEILDPQENEVVCDPTCGSGGFLIKVFEYIREKIEKDIQAKKEEFRTQLEGQRIETLKDEHKMHINHLIDHMQNSLNTELNTRVKNSRMNVLSTNCIYGTDANPRMARTSKMNMIMHGDGHGGVHHHDGLLNVNGIFENRFDVILTNPPFGQNVDRNQIISTADKFTDEELKAKYRQKYGEKYDEALKQVDDNIGKPLLSLYDLGTSSTLTEVLFMERCLRLLKKGGRMGIVLPEGVLNNKNLQSVRDYFEGKAKIILICSIPQDVFIAAGATVKPSLVFFKKFTQEEEDQYKKAQEDALKESAELHKEETKALEERLQKCAELTQRLKDTIETQTENLRKAKKEKKETASFEKFIKEAKESQKENDKEKKEILQEQKLLQKQIEQDAKPIVKQKFDYQIPIAKIEDAGITTTGAASENNQLPQLAKEFREYAQKNNLWNNNIIKYKYDVRDTQEQKVYYRINADGTETQLKEAE